MPKQISKQEIKMTEIFRNITFSLKIYVAAIKIAEILCSKFSKQKPYFIYLLEESVMYSVLLYIYFEAAYFLTKNNKRFFLALNFSLLFFIDFIEKYLPKEIEVIKYTSIAYIFYETTLINLFLNESNCQNQGYDSIEEQKCKKY